MRGSFLRPLALPLLLVGLLAAVLGFFVTRTIAGDRDERTAQVSVVGIPATPTPTPTEEPSPSPSPTAGGSGGSGRGESQRPSCPSGCECSFPPGGTVIVCRGGQSLRLP